MFHLIDLGSFCFFVYTNLFARLLLRFLYISVLKKSPEYGQLLGQEKLLFAQQPKVEQMSLYPPKNRDKTSLWISFQKLAFSLISRRFGSQFRFSSLFRSVFYSRFCSFLRPLKEPSSEPLVSGDLCRQSQHFFHVEGKVESYE